jgi:alanyl-tRNA synthetase/misacylated tRNA(Ala) deacylase
MSSYLRTLRTRVVSCAPATASSGVASKKAKGSAVPADDVPARLFDVVLADSVFFPEGGGQPCDLGTIDGQPCVVAVVRDGASCVIKSALAFEPGAEVDTAVDWPRRLDHMQHHSAQHLLTAIVERELQLPTESWSLTHPSCFIQLPAAAIAEADVRRVEAICNEYISSGTAVERRVFASREEVPESRSRAIPADVRGPIRIIDIAGVDCCTCCGTHVESLAALRMIKLLHQEPKGNTCKLHFVAGDRVDRMFTSMYARERRLVKELGTNAENIVAAVVRRGKESTDGEKQCRKLLAEVAALTAPALVAQALALPPGAVFTFHREDVDMDFLAVVGEALSRSDGTRAALLGAGSDAANGQFLLLGPTEAVARLAPAVLAAVDGKGGQSRHGFRGKGNMKKWSAAVEAVKTV